jgi:hypothetical protein
MPNPRVNINYNCGCGYKCISFTEAEKHVEESGHSIDVSGKIVGQKKARIILVVEK